MKINNKSIIKDNNPLIREKSLDVSLPLSDEDRSIMNDMMQYVIDSTNPEIAEKEELLPAVGISAIQIGIKKKMCAIYVHDEEGNIIHQLALVNPKIISYSIEESYLAGGEGCLSVPEQHEGYVYRSRRIKVKAYDAINNQETIFRANGYLAIILQHEIDHMSGILYYDHIDSKNPFIEKQGAFKID